MLSATDSLAWSKLVSKHEDRSEEQAKHITALDVQNKHLKQLLDEAETHCSTFRRWVGLVGRRMEMGRASGTLAWVGSV